MKKVKSPVSGSVNRRSFLKTGMLAGEQGGSSLYASLSQKVSSREVLKITLGIGGDEVAHFLEWVDFSGNGVQPPVAPVTDQGLTFPNFFNPLNPLVQPSLIFPVLRTINLQVRWPPSQASPPMGYSKDKARSSLK